MDFSKIVTEIDSQISKLQEAKSALSGLALRNGITSRAAKRAKPRRRLSAAARAKIAAAQKRRWAKVKGKAS